MARIDSALASWPGPEPGALDRDERAQRIIARVMEEASGDLSDPDLLRPPLPALGEPAGDGSRARGPFRRWLMASGVAAMAAATVAAVGLLVVRRPTVEQRASSEISGEPAHGASATSRPAYGAAAPSALSLPIDRPGIDPSDLPLASGAAARAPRAVASQGPTRGAGAARPARAAEAIETPAALAESPPSDDSLQPAAAVAPGSSLAGAPSSVPRRPSVGAIQGALGAALPAARACLGPGDPPYRATVTFQSDGNVRSVSFQDDEAGGSGSERRPEAEACVRTALGKAQVPPFAESAYGAPVTVRAVRY